jgi:hypothetical protein
MNNWPGLVAVILAAGVAICVIALALGTATQSGPISQEDATLLSTVLGAAVGATATFLGTNRTTAPTEPPTEPTEPPSTTETAE